MAWDDPGSISNGTDVTAVYLNKFVDSLLYVRKPNSYYADNLATLSFTNTAWASLGASYEATINVSSTTAYVLVVLSASMRNGTAGGNEGFLDVEIDGTRQGDTNRGLASITQYANAGTVATGGNLLFPHTFIQLYTGLSAGNHTFKIMGKTQSAAHPLFLAVGHHVIIKEL